MLTLTKVLPALISSGSFTGSFYGTSSYAKKALTASYAMNGGSGGSSLNTGSTYPITSSFSRKSITASYLTTISQSLIPAKNNTYSLGTTTVRWKDLFVSTGSIYIGDVKLSTSGSTVLANSFPIVVVNTSSKQLEVPGLRIQLTSSYANKALTASYVTGVGVGSSGTSGAAGSSGTSGGNGSSGTSGQSGTSATAGSSGNSGASGTSGTSGTTGSSGSSGTSATAGSSGTSGVGSPGTSGTAGSSGTSSTATVQTGSLAKQTTLYNVTSGSQNIITGLNLSGNKWGVDIKEEWDSVSGDVYYANTSLLLHFSGSNNSTTIVNDGSNSANITVSGAAKITSAFSKFGGTSLFLGGTNGNYITVPVVSGGPFDVNNQNFTVECYIYITATSTGYIASRYNSSAGSGNYNWSLSISSTGKLEAVINQFNNNNISNIITGLTTLTTNTWNHIAYVKSSSLQTLFLNGNKDASGSITVTTSDSGQSIRIGTAVNLNGSTNAPIAGYIDEFRITKNIARYTSNFITQSVPFPNKLPQYATKYIGLIGGLNDRNVDYGIQKLSDSSLKVVKMSQTTSPFPSGSLSASVDRVYVNILDYSKVSVTSSYATNALTASYILGGGANGSSGTSGATGAAGTSGTSGNGGTSGSSGTSATAGSSGTSGVGSPGTSGTAGSSGTSSTSTLQTGSLAKQTILYNVTSGSQNVITGLNLSGNKWGVDIKEEWDAKSGGGDQYFSNVVLLLPFTGSNGSTTMTNVSQYNLPFTAYGNAQLSTAQYKFPPTSLYLDGNGDYLTTPNTSSLLLGTSDFTIECFLYLTQNGTTSFGETYAPIIQLGNYFAATSNSRVFYSLIYNPQAGNRLTFSTKPGDGFGPPDYYAASSDVINIPLNTWVYVAITRTSNQLKFWYNGNLVGTDSTYSWNSINLNVNAGANNNLYIGRMSGTSVLDQALWYFPGYLSNIRITKGVARYTNTFVTSSVAFPKTGVQVQYATKYVGLIGGLNDKTVDYGVQKLSDTSLKVVKMTQTTSPFPSGSLSSSVDRVYVNVLNYTNVSVTSSYATNALTASYILGGGANGSSGTSGNNGTSGTSGTSSTAGSSGTSGQNGTSATAGSSGSSGNSGTSGTSGATGASGTSGSSGSSGTSGTTGSSGSSGNNGTSGSSGATGASGSSGTSGGGASLRTGSLYPITSSWSRRSLTASYALNASGGGSSLAGAQTFISNGSQTVYTLNQSVVNRDQILVVTNGVVQSRTGSNYTVSGTTLTLSEAVQSGGLVDVRYINAGQGSSGTSGINGTVQTGSIAKQTILYNVTSGSQNVITGLNLSGNKWGVDIKEEWDEVISSGDQYYNSCSLLLHCDGTNGSTTFTDNSPSPKTVTSNNGAAISTTQSKFGGASAFFDGTNDYLNTPSSAAFDFGTGDFTVEFWVNPSSLGGSAALVGTRTNDTSTTIRWCIFVTTDTGINVLGCDIWSTSDTRIAQFNHQSQISTGQWTHCALVRYGTSFKLYQNGVQSTSGATTSAPVANSSTVVNIGSFINSAISNFNGYIDEIRITKGVARYTSNFTPSSVAFPNNTGLTQYATKYVGLIGGLNDKSVDYGVQKLNDTSLKVVKMSQTTSPFPSGSLSASVDRVYVNVLDYSKVAVTSSYATNALNSVNSLDIPKIKSIIYTNSSYVPTTSSFIDIIKPNTNYITISGSNFKPSASVFIDSTSGSVVTYVNSTKLNVNVVSKNEGTYPIYLSNVDGASTFKINAITYITSLDQFQYVVVAGGGGGGIAHAGGGGAGGFRTGSLGLNRAVTYSVSIGSGGATSPSRSVNGTNGSNSVFASITSIGGGGGGSEYKGGNSGGSGGGGATAGSGGAGTLLQGNAGGAGSPSNPPFIGGGGGGAGAVGGNTTPTSAGNGGIGGISSITGTSTYYAGGGGGGAYGGYAGVTSAGTGGLGGGGNGNYGNGNGSAGTTNRGGGGGGGGYFNENGYNGGSGIVILKYLSSRTLTIGVGLTSSTVTTGSYKITTFTAGSDTIIIS